MKRNRIARLLCAAVLTASLCGMSGISSSALTVVTAQLSPNVNIQIDGTVRNFYNSQGQEMHPILYNGTTYLPLRAIGELMNKNVNWDGTTDTVTLSGTRTTGPVTGTPDNASQQTPVTFYLRPEITVVIDGTVRTFYGGDGKQVDPTIYEGSIYLPIRTIGEIMGKSVAWDGNTQTVILSTPSSGNGAVTDFDTGSPSTPVTPTAKPSVPTTPTTPPANQGGAITLEKAKQIALNHAGKTADQVTFVKVQKEFDDWRWEYEVEFVAVSGNSYLEYDYEIDASTGKIISYDYDIEGYVPSTGGGAAGTTVSEATAKNTALAQVPGATLSDIFKFKKDFDDGRWEYEGKIIYNQMEYEFTIDASTGAIVEWDVESIYD